MYFYPSNPCIILEHFPRSLGFINYAAVTDGALVSGGDRQPATSGAGIGEVNDAFLIDASVDPPLIRTLPKATIAREETFLIILSSGVGVTFLGSTYSNLASPTAYAYFTSTQTFSIGGLSGSTSAAFSLHSRTSISLSTLICSICSCFLILVFI